ncbi:NADH-quinone oxidoreductase chain 5 [Candidatus Kinetoplastibacterium sorsogonicusi]|uniref:NADH-quinone oxidoreductase subunit C n=1 Tax=Candidatus Kinetoplastidibacterium kentomonadis TaxID=1576550 RepID=A0A3Q8F3S7_9PROT|nr:NADH-quinone oxidoreductase subunit C [Candidatus Kinetoplastibacterium sorsogonicusi]AWD32594.1 NADH-quinone oxidoreductase chain 5 [Candidatus Kinetoplastibacterium sorsogonicusi]
MNSLLKLKSILEKNFTKNSTIECKFNEITLNVSENQWLDTCFFLKNHIELNFDVCVDLCVIDYLTWNLESRELDSKELSTNIDNRFSVVIHLLSISNNWRLRVKSSIKDSELPSIESLTTCWPSVGWFEREAFDLFGITFNNHNDLRRILTDYGFIGHPMRKDFPLSGNVEITYDKKAKKVKYQKTNIIPREITPRVVHYDNKLRSNNHGRN